MRIIHNFFIIFVLLGPLIELVIPFELFGFKVWNTLLPMSLVCLFILIKPDKVFLIKLGAIALISSMIIFIRFSLYEEDLLDMITSSWILFFPLLSFYFLKDIDYKYIYPTLLFILIFHGLSGLLYYFGLPTIEILSDRAELVGEGHRFEGIYAASNIYSNTLLALFIFVTSIKLYKSIPELVLLCFISLITIVSIQISGSRLPFILLGIYLIICIKKIRNPYYLSFIILVLLALIYRKIDFIIEFISNSRIYVTGLSDISRQEKFFYSIDILFQGPLSFLIGPPLIDHQNQFVNVSDNSLSLLYINFGFIFAIFWFVQHLYFIKKISLKNLDNLFLTIVVLITCLLNNSLLHHTWIIVILLIGIFYYRISKLSKIG